MDMGIKFAIPGEDVTRAPDYKMVFSTGFKTLPVVKSERVIISNTAGARQLIFTHNLGFIPMFFVYDYDLATGTAQFANNDNNGFRVDEEDVYSIGNGNPARTIFYILFNIDLRKEILPKPANPGKDEILDVDRLNDVGVRFAKTRKGASSRDLRDFTVHSKARSPMISSLSQHNGPVNIEHKLGYAPTFFIYGAPNNPAQSGYQFYQLGPATGLPITAESNDQYVKVVTTITRNFSVVVMKDPI